MTFTETMSKNKKYLYAVGVALVVAATSYCVWNYGLQSSSIPAEGKAFEDFKLSQVLKLADEKIAKRKFEDVTSETIVQDITNNKNIRKENATNAATLKKYDADLKKYNESGMFNFINFYSGVSKPKGERPVFEPRAETTIPEDLLKAQVEKDFKEFSPEQVQSFVTAEKEAIRAAQTKENETTDFTAELETRNQEIAENNALWYKNGRNNAIAGTVLAVGAGAGTYYKMNADEVAAQKAADAKALADKKAADAAAAQKAKDDQKKPTEAKVDPTTGETIATEGEGKDGENKTTDAENNDDSSGLGAWWILIILAILALAGGAVYFFVFMPKEEDEEFDAEAQVEEEL